MTTNPLDYTGRPPAEVPTQVAEVAADTRARLERAYLAAGVEANVVARLLEVGGPILQAALLRLAGT